MKTIQAYRYALDLTPSQERAMLAHAGAARLAHNWALARVKAVMDQRAAERSYGVPIVLGDHQPATIVSRNDATHNVPITITSHDPTVTDKIASGAGKTACCPARGASVADDHVPRPFLTAYGP